MKHPVVEAVYRCKSTGVEKVIYELSPAHHYGNWLLYGRSGDYCLWKLFDDPVDQELTKIVSQCMSADEYSIAVTHARIKIIGICIDVSRDGSLFSNYPFFECPVDNLTHWLKNPFVVAEIDVVLATHNRWSSWTLEEKFENVRSELKRQEII